MGVSATGQNGLSVRSVRTLLVVIMVAFGLAVYLYGPPVTPAFRTAANEACNEYAGGNYRDYQLDWLSVPGNSPHWSCWDRSRPQKKAISLGWWVDPFS